MRLRHHLRKSDTTLQMSSMIDVVFLLLIFFVMTFQIVAAEGDLAISPSAESSDRTTRGEWQGETFHVHLAANASGDLSGVQFGERRLEGLAELNHLVRDLVEQHVAIGNTATDLAVVLHVDEALQYKHTIAALSAIRGYRQGSGVRSLIENVRFAKRRTT